MQEPRFICHTFRDTRLPRDPARSIQGIYYHGISHGSYYGWYAEQMIMANLRLGAPGFLPSPNYCAYLDPEFARHHISIRDQEINDLMRNGQTHGGLTPRAIGRLNNAPDSIELDFEAKRRLVSPESPSRLECLYVADNENTIRQIFPNDQNLIILKVIIVEALRFKKADYKWIDRYRDETNLQYIEDYWLSRQCDEGVNNWEYLVDGLIMVDDPEGIGALRQLWSEEGSDDF